MSQLDFLILFIYLITVIYVFLQMYKSLNDMYSVKAEPADPLDQQLRSQNFQDDLVEIKFPFDNRYEYGKLIRIPIEIKNNSPQPIYAKWDNSSITDFLGKSRRVLRVPASLTLDLLQDQAPSVIAPEKTLKEKLSAEDVFVREEENVKITEKPFIDFSALKKGSKPEKKKYVDFHEFNIVLPIDLKLTLSLFDPVFRGGDYRLCYLRYTLNFRKLPWYSGLPWNPPR
jgi:hypothetical protein